jgi:hypothetical protein
MHLIELQPNHRWKAAPGCRIVVLDGGAVRLDIPKNWLVCPRGRNVLFFDQEPPETRSSLGLSWHLIPHSAMNLPLRTLLMNGSATEKRRIVQFGGICEAARPPLEVAWLQMRVVDMAEKREMCTRMCVARAGCTQAVMLFEFRPEDEAIVFGIWETLLATLVVGEYIADPRTGERREKRG